LPSLCKETERLREYEVGATLTLKDNSKNSISRRHPWAFSGEPRHFFETPHCRATFVHTWEMSVPSVGISTTWYSN